MADLSKMKHRTTLGTPPSFAEASQNLQAPEIAPLAPLPKKASRPSDASSRNTVSTQKYDEDEYQKRMNRIDGRSLRRTGRTVQLATRVSWEFDEKLRRIAQRDGLKLVEVLEQALHAYETIKNT